MTNDGEFDSVILLKVVFLHEKNSYSDNVSMRRFGVFVSEIENYLIYLTRIDAVFAEILTKLFESRNSFVFHCLI